MPLDRASVDEIHGRMLIRYGQAWMNQWAGVEIELVKADWAQCLENLTRRQINYGLVNLPLEAPPKTAFAFKQICLSCPPEEKKLIGHKPRLNPEAARKVADLVARAFRPGDARAKLDAQVARVEAMPNKTAAQKAWLDAVKRAPVGRPIGPGDFIPVPLEALPPSMRAAAQSGEVNIPSIGLQRG